MKQNNAIKSSGCDMGLLGSLWLPTIAFKTNTELFKNKARNDYCSQVALATLVRGSSLKTNGMIVIHSLLACIHFQ